MHPCAGRMPRSPGSTGSPPENVKAKIPVIAQTRPEITKAPAIFSPMSSVMALQIRTAEIARRRRAAVKYLFGFLRFIFSLSVLYVIHLFHLLLLLSP
jgi:hypothetical protein